MPLIPPSRIVTFESLQVSWTPGIEAVATIAGPAVRQWAAFRLHLSSDFLIPRPDKWVVFTDSVTAGNLMSRMGSSPLKPCA